VWGSAAVTLPALDVAPPFVFWGAEEVGIDLSTTPCTPSRPA
jgi:hypothetical protein